MDLFHRLLHTFFPPTQEKIAELISHMGVTSFCVVVFAIVFCETGLVILPFLPGDSLLFAVGAIGSGDKSPYSVPLLGVLVVVAALLGDNTNYWLGRTLGPKIFSQDVKDEGSGGANGGVSGGGLKSKLLNRKHLDKTQAFYAKYGSKMVILARFVPIVRTFAPFVAGVGKMNYGRFLLFSVIGAVLWVAVCMGAGFALGQVEFVKKRFEVVAIVIVLISVLPMAVEFWRERRKLKAEVNAP